MQTVNSIQSPEHRINLRLLVWLRVIAIAGQLAAVYFATQKFNIKLETHLLYSWIGIYALINVITYLRIFSRFSIQRWEFFAHLLVDIFILTILFKYSEGGANPFVSLYLIPLTISAITLPGIFTWSLASITITCYSLLVWVIQPMNDHSSHAQNFELHVTGMWLGFVISALLVSFFVVRMGRTIQQQQKQLAEQKNQDLQNEQLIKLGTIAASTAHELGTPLGTMQLMVEQLERNSLNKSHTQLDTLKDQIKRCKDALSVLSASVGSAPLEQGEPMLIQSFIDDLLHDWVQTRPGVNLETSWSGEIPGPTIIAERSLKQAIKNILDNAANVSPEYVSCDAFIKSKALTLQVSDLGPGLELDNSYNYGNFPHPNENSVPTKGLGLGLFLSHGIIKRFGGKISLKNRIEGGLQTTISLPLQNLTVG
ncbi:MAG: ATP-binding protein [Pseudomonadota bacterium]